jgi:hypothetical protein
MSNFKDAHTLILPLLKLLPSSANRQDSTSIFLILSSLSLSVAG